VPETRKERTVKLLLRVAAATLLLLFAFSAATMAASPTLPHTGRVLVSVQGDVTLPAGEHADVVVVVKGTATILGEAGTVVTVDGAANLQGARTETIVAVRSAVTLGAGTVVLGDVRTFDATVQRVGDAQVVGRVGDLGVDLAGIGLILGPAILLLTLGFALAAMAAALLLAAVAARQVRAAEFVISHEPGMTLLVGIAGIVVTPIIAILAIVTIVGAPLGVGLLLFLWPLAAFLGYLVAAIWIGDWVLRRGANQEPRERPYLAAVLGVVILEIMGIVPPLAALASLFGFGAVILVTWRTFRSRSQSAQTAPSPWVASAPA
jgi:hypothetical protein